MRVEVTLIAGDPQDPVVGYQKVTYVAHAEPGSVANWAEAAAKLVVTAEEGLEEVRGQVDGITAQIQREERG